tara:strand:- start:426398 stop:426718 length:321 start_codon:yes stop_codon:yes gene_type:complete
MSLTFKQFAALREPARVIVCSLEQALYQVLVVVAEREQLLKENDGRPFRRHNLNQIREALQGMPVAALLLRHQSAYDEMVGQPVRAQDNTLEVPLSLDIYPDISRH